MAWWEAESGTRTLPLGIEHASPNVSGSAYVRAPGGYDTPPSSGRLGFPNVATYVFTVPEDGIYRLAWRIGGRPTGASALWVRISDMVTNTTNHSSGWIDFGKIWVPSAWQWYEVHSTTNGGQVVEFTLSAGSHTLDIAGQAATLFDAIALIR